MNDSIGNIPKNEILVIEGDLNGVMFKIYLIMFKIKNKISPVHLTNSIRIPNRSGLRSSSFNHNFVYRVKHFRAPLNS